MRTCISFSLVFFLVSASITLNVSANIIYEQDFSSDPNFTSIYTPTGTEYFTWDKSEGVYKVRINDASNVYKYTISPQFSRVQDVSFTVSVDINRKYVSFGQGMRVRFFDSDVGYTQSSFSIHHKGSTNGWSSKRIRIGEDNPSEYVYWSPMTSPNTWYRVTIIYNALSKTANIEIIERDTGALFYQQVNVPFNPAPFNQFGFGDHCIWGEGTYAILYFDNILIQSDQMSAVTGAPIEDAEVSNVKFSQEGNGVIITYDLEGDDAFYDVRLSCSIDGGKTFDIIPKAVSGDVGNNVKPGKNKMIRWELLRDFPRGLRGEEFVFKVSAEVRSAPRTARKFSNSLDMEFVLISAGSFMMGSPPGETGRELDEMLHRVTISKPFYMQTTEVTQGQWKAMMEQNPSGFKRYGDDCPVERVSWYYAQEFIRRLNQLEGTDKYRLPTEAEWEYACRAGNKKRFFFGDDDTKLRQYAWYLNNSGERTHPVGRKKPNALGLYDMHGNVWEWCQDWYSEYPKDHVTDPIGPTKGHFKVKRGGWQNNGARWCRSANRGYRKPYQTTNAQGFRLARTP